MMHTMIMNFQKNKLNEAVDDFMCRHPYVNFLALFIGTPILILIAVSVCTTAIMAPIAWLMGWI